ncbi:MAG TPA: hypothetical protein VF940_26680, partial [Streptosporangiaceae bacterium]
GQVRVTRMAYRAPGAANLYPADAALNLPAGKYSHGLRRLAAAQAARGKWLTASIAAEIRHVIAAVFDEAGRRDPGHTRPWVALVDGNPHQIRRITAEAARRGVPVTILIDFIHVLEYLWQAAWSLHREADPAAETWVAAHARAILDGHAPQVAAAIRAAADTAALTGARRAAAARAARYLDTKHPYLSYPRALTAGWPISTGVIEGACRYLVKDRMDITGARWSVPGAEAILKLRALTANGDFDTYWTHHLQQEQHRNHHARYLNTAIPRAA